MNNLTLGSLFDGSGGFPLGGLISGITPVWASEIEPFPIRVTTKRLPFMKHYGDISGGHHHLRLTLHGYVRCRSQSRTGRTAICAVLPSHPHH